MFAYDKTFDPKVFLGHCQKQSSMLSCDSSYFPLMEVQIINLLTLVVHPRKVEAYSLLLHFYCMYLSQNKMATIGNKQNDFRLSSIFAKELGSQVNAHLPLHDG